MAASGTGALESGGNLDKIASTQYTDGAAAPTHPIGNEIVFNNNGTMTAVSNSNPLPTFAPTNYALETGGNLASIAAFSTTVSNLSASALNALFVSPIDISAYAWWSLSIVGNNHVGQLSWQGSNDNFVNEIVGMYAYQQNVPSAYYQNDTNVGNAVHIFHGARTSRYFRVIMNAYTGGSVSGNLTLFKMPSFAGSINAIQTGTWTVQPGNTQNTTPWLFAGPTNNFTQTANTAGVVVGKNAAGYLWSAVVTATGTAQLDIYDNAAAASGTKLLSIPANAAVGTIYNFPGGARANNGIVSNGVANCPGVTFYYS